MQAGRQGLGLPVLREAPLPGSFVSNPHRGTPALEICIIAGQRHQAVPAPDADPPADPPFARPGRGTLQAFPPYSHKKPGKQPSFSTKVKGSRWHSMPLEGPSDCLLPRCPF